MGLRAGWYARKQGSPIKVGEGAPYSELVRYYSMDDRREHLVRGTVLRRKILAGDMWEIDYDPRELAELEDVWK